MDVMLDLETLGKDPGCAILSIGAVAFDPTNGRTGASFYVNVSSASCQAAGLVIDAKTLAWWMEQKTEALRVLFDNPSPLADALEAFDRFFIGADGAHLWCHGAGFDEPILGAAYRRLDRAEPWKFRDVRDTRTIYDLAGVKPEHREGSVQHNALHDAVAQAAAVARAWRILKPSAAEAA